MRKGQKIDIYSHAQYYICYTPFTEKCYTPSTEKCYTPSTEKYIHYILYTLHATKSHEPTTTFGCCA
jgi:hypothetical protein